MVRRDKGEVPMYIDDNPLSYSKHDVLRKEGEVREHWSGALKVVALLGIFALAIYFNHELTYAAFGIGALLLGIKVTGWLHRNDNRGNR